MPNGVCCHSPALRGTYFCYFHTRLHRQAAKQSRGQVEPLKISLIEDRCAMQVAVAQIMNALTSKTINSREAGILLYALQIASQNVPHNPNILQVNAVKSVTLSPEGEELAPERVVCSPGNDCPNCDVRDRCEKYQPEPDEEDEEEEKK